MSKINLLDDIAIGKIAAGEVIERPASVIKELVENSLDAGADSVEVEISDAGTGLIRVADNGEGMSGKDAERACLRHATSKIRDASDLERIRTLGFRGEGLSSIAAVSQMDITSYDGCDEAGIYLYLEEGKVIRSRPAGRARGTTIEVRNLFYNVPARRKFLRKPSTELAEIVKVMNRFMVSRPGTGFSLKQGERTLLSCSVDAGLGERISMALGTDLSSSMVRVDSGEAGGACVKGFVSEPGNTRKDNSAQMFFVNGRFVKSRALADGVYSAFKSMLERGRHPSAVLFLDVPSEEVDVNVHPTKLLVKFNDDRRIKEFISEAVKRSFDPAETSGDKLSTPETGGREYDTEESPSDEEEQAEFDISLDGGAS
ncbi:MAG: DNA mismatch repair endonuclease MutL, partial [Candidatus Omnitrophica bacterium]|nr:DNA mismatch repair endonuclease MutL [Candidatus Omnitrophota bacterium]